MELTREQLRKLILESISKVTSKGVEIDEPQPKEGEYTLDLGSEYYGQMGAHLRLTDLGNVSVGVEETRVIF